MKVLELECPGCRVKLRLRDRLQGGRAFGCPDCHKGLMLVEVAGTFEVTLQPNVLIPLASEASTKFHANIEAKQKNQSKLPIQAATQRRKNQFAKWLSDPWTVAWMLALGFTFLFIRVVLWPRPLANPIPKLNNQQVETPPLKQNLPEKVPIVEEPIQPTQTANPELVPNEQINQSPSVTNNSMGVQAPENIVVTPSPSPKTEISQEPQTKVIGIEEMQADGTMKQATSVINLEQTLSLTIKKYQQSNPLAAKVLLVELEPLTGVEIQTRKNDQAAEKILAEKQVQLPELENVSVKVLLEMFAKELGLVMVPGDQVIYFQSLDYISEKPTEN